MHGNLFDYGVPPLPRDSELFDTLWTGDGVRVERIVSAGQSSPPGFWYDQKEDEWVLLLQGQAELEYEGGVFKVLESGDWLLIPAGSRHRVAFTSSDPVCVWLAVFCKNKGS